MKPVCVLAVVLLVVSPLLAEDTIRVLSVNVRCSTAKDGENNWLNRRDFLTDILAEGDYDFIGTQEAVLNPVPALNQVAYIASKLPNYEYYGRSREVFPRVGEATMIFYEKNRWKIDDRDKKTFWLSALPNIPGSKTDFTAGNPRTVTVALFHELQNGEPTGRRIYIYNTHFDHKSEEARQRGAKQLMEHIAGRKLKDVPVVLIGDMNSGEMSPVVRFIQGEPMERGEQEWEPPYRLIDTFRAVHPDATDVGTNHKFLGQGRRKIDYIFVSPGFRTLSAEIIRTQRNGRYPSDHFPVNAVIAW